MTGDRSKTSRDPGDVARGLVIKTGRIKAGIFRRQLADEVEISPSHLANIENGYTGASPEILARIANRLGLPLNLMIEDAA